MVDTPGIFQLRFKRVTRHESRKPEHFTLCGFAFRYSLHATRHCSYRHSGQEQGALLLYPRLRHATFTDSLRVIPHIHPRHFLATGIIEH